jgi:hypothetical protein
MSQDFLLQQIIHGPYCLSHFESGILLLEGRSIPADKNNNVCETKFAERIGPIFG